MWPHLSTFPCDFKAWTRPNARLLSPVAALWILLTSSASPLSEVPHVAGHRPNPEPRSPRCPGPSRLWLSHLCSSRLAVQDGLFSAWQKGCLSSSYSLSGCQGAAAIPAGWQEGAALGRSDSLKYLQGYRLRGSVVQRQTSLQPQDWEQPETGPQSLPVPGGVTQAGFPGLSHATLPVQETSAGLSCGPCTLETPGTSWGRGDRNSPHCGRGAAGTSHLHEELAAAVPQQLVQSHLHVKGGSLPADVQLLARQAETRAVCCPTSTTRPANALAAGPRARTAPPATAREEGVASTV